MPFHVLSSEQGKEPPPLGAMRRGTALGAWVLLASLAGASWGVRGKSQGVGPCPQAAAVTALPALDHAVYGMDHAGPFWDSSNPPCSD